MYSLIISRKWMKDCLMIKNIYIIIDFNQYNENIKYLFSIVNINGV